MLNLLQLYFQGSHEHFTEILDDLVVKKEKRDLIRDPPLVGMPEKTCNLHIFRQTNFYKNMENAEILHSRFRQKIHATCKILQEFACNKDDSYKIFTCKVLTQ